MMQHGGWFGEMKSDFGNLSEVFPAECSATTHRQTALNQRLPLHRFSVTHPCPRFDLNVFIYSPALLPARCFTHQSTVSPRSFLQAISAARGGTEHSRKSRAGRHQAGPAGILVSRLRRASPEWLWKEKLCGAGCQLCPRSGERTQPGKPGPGQGLLGNCSPFLWATKWQVDNLCFWPQKKKYRLFRIFMVFCFLKKAPTCRYRKPFYFLFSAPWLTYKFFTTLWQQPLVFRQGKQDHSQRSPAPPSAGGERSPRAVPQSAPGQRLQWPRELSPGTEPDLWTKGISLTIS